MRWNRLVGAWYNAGDMSDPNERVARCEYDGLPALDGPQCCQGVRRTGKTITNQGTGIEPDSSDYYGNVTPVEIGDRHEQVRHLPAGGTPAPCGTGNLPVNLLPCRSDTALPAYSRGEWLRVRL